MGDKTIQAKLNDIAVILFDSPFKPALSKRKDFIIAALIVLVRGVISYILLSFILEIQPSMNFSDESWAITVLLAIPAAAIFLAPYFFVFYRRLKGVGFPHPSLLAWLLFIVLNAYAIVTPETTITIKIIDTLLSVVPYLTLMVFKDKEAKEEQTEINV